MSDRTRFVCPECSGAAPIYDHVERQWRHLDTCQFTTHLHAAVPRVDCPAHGVKTIHGDISIEVTEGTFLLMVDIIDGGDLAASMGLIGRSDDPAAPDAIRRLESAIVPSPVHLGGVAQSADQASAISDIRVAG